MLVDNQVPPGLLRVRELTKSIVINPFEPGKTFRLTGVDITFQQSGQGFQMHPAPFLLPVWKENGLLFEIDKLIEAAPQLVPALRTKA